MWRLSRERARRGAWTVGVAALVWMSRALPRTADPAPILVELFTSEGCSSCPPADALLRTLSASHQDVIAVGEHVDYWDAQGWKDPFSSAAFTQRQQLYGARFNIDSVYTPQMVVDGRVEFVGSDAQAAARALARARQAAHGRLAITVESASSPTATFVVRIENLPGDRARPADLIVAIVEDGLSSTVTRGENRGRVLTHGAVARTVKAAGDAVVGVDHRVSVPILPAWRREHLSAVAFVQERRGGAVLASARAAVR